LIAASILGRVLEDEIAQYIVGGLNRHIRAEVKVDQVKLSFLKKFPDASLEFKDVFIASVPDFLPDHFNERNTDTLLVASHLFLRFNILKLLKRQYFVREVQIRSGKLNVFIDRAGNGNYTIWEKKDKAGDKNFLLELDNVNLSDILVAFDNRALEIDIRGMVRKSYFKGKFSTESYAMSAGLEGMLQEYRKEGNIFMRGQKVSSRASLLIDPQTIKISDGNLLMAGQHVLLTGEILRPRPLELDLNLEGKYLDLEYVLRHLVVSSDKIPDDLTAGGILDFSGKIKGVASNTQMPWIEANFSLHDGWLRSSRFPQDVREIHTKGSYSNGIRRGPQTTLIRLNDVSMKFGNSRVGGDYSVFNLMRPDFNYQIKAELDLSDIQRFISKDSLVGNMQGRILGEIGMQGDQALLKNFSKGDLLNYDYQADLHLENVSFDFKKIPLSFKNFSGEVVFTDHLALKNLSGIVEESQVSISGRADNFLEYLFTSGANLWMDVDLYSERLDLNYPGFFKSGVKKGIKKDSVFFPERLFLKTRFWFDELEIKDFTATQVTGDLIYKPQRLSINKVELQSMDGRIISEGILEQQHDMHILVKSISKISSVDITSAFSSFNNFGQNFIVDHHLKGSLSGTVNFSAGLDEKMRIKKETILADCDVTIIDGELSGFEPMMKLSKFIEVEELENIHFSTLTNEIFIRNEEVVIPKMDIASSAADITASGIHGFDKNFTYKTKVALSEILTKKTRRTSGKDSEFGIVEDDGLGRVYMYLIIEGSPEGTDVRYDRRGAVQNIREQMQAEKQELKGILKEEFGLFKKDSTLQKENMNNESPAFMLEWEEQRDSTFEPEKRKNNNLDKERFIIEWDEGEIEPVEPEIGKKKNRKKK